MNGDFCTNEGALKLKQKIEAYWKDRGFDVNIDLVDAGFVAAMRSGRTDVRSNMVNGMPSRNEGKASRDLVARKKPMGAERVAGWA
ncbi:hypothetical protein [Ponticaulis profundi]|uniref:Phosphoglycolate phosphatase n=1 Tax=Ponticaulis profundi TaxID=2665222 RepID=A0ABW1SEA5_9PROT